MYWKIDALKNFFCPHQVPPSIASSTWDVALQGVDYKCENNAAGEVLELHCALVEPGFPCEGTKLAYLCQHLGLIMFNVH